MGIVNWFICKVDDPEATLISDQMAMAVADGEFTDDERDEMISICQENGITNTLLWNTLRGEKIIHRPVIPQTGNERKKYIGHLINIMAADDYCSPLEIHTLGIISQRMGLSKMEILALMTDKVKAGHIERRKEFAILESYIDTAIAIEKSI